eukprot:132964_1
MSTTENAMTTSNATSECEDGVIDQPCWCFADTDDCTNGGGDDMECYWNDGECVVDCDALGATCSDKPDSLIGICCDGPEGCVICTEISYDTACGDDDTALCECFDVDCPPDCDEELCVGVEFEVKTQSEVNSGGSAAGSSTGETVGIIGGVIGSVVLLVILLIVGGCLYFKKRNKYSNVAAEADLEGGVDIGRAAIVTSTNTTKDGENSQNGEHGEIRPNNIIKAEDSEDDEIILPQNTTSGNTEAALNALIADGNDNNTR